MPLITKDYLNMLPGGQNPNHEKLYGFVPGGWLPNWVKDGYNKSIEGMAQQVINGKPVFTLDKKYDPNMVEDIFSTVVSFLAPTDIAAMALGGGIGGVAIKKIVTNKMIKAQANKALVKSVSNKATERAIQQATVKALKSPAGKATMGATGLGFYSGLQSALGQKVTNDDVELVATLKDIGVGASLGAITGGVGAKVSAFGKAKGYTPKQIMAMEKGAEVGVFGTAGPLFEGELPSAESYVHAAGVIGGLTASRALGKGVIKAPRRELEGAELERAYQKDAENLAKRSAEKQRGEEVWTNRFSHEDVIIKSDWTNKEKNIEALSYEIVSGENKGKTKNKYRKEFFNEYYRKTDYKGKDVATTLRNKTFKDKAVLEMSDLDFKMEVDAVRGGEPSPLKKHKAKGREYHSNYNKLSIQEKTILHDRMKSRRFVENKVKEFKDLGIEVSEVTGKSLMEKALPPAVYDTVRGLTPMGARLRQVPLVKYVMKQIYDLDFEMADLNKRQLELLGNAVYTTVDGKKIKGLEKLSEEQATQLGRDMASSDAGAIKRSRHYRLIAKGQYGVAKKSGLELAPEIENYFPKMINKNKMREFIKEIDEFVKEDYRALGSNLESQTGLEQRIERAVLESTGELSNATRETIIEMVKDQKDRGEKRSYARAFQTIKDEVFGQQIAVNKNLEVARMKNSLPDDWYETDARHVLANYASNLSKRVAYVKVAGVKGDKVTDNIDVLSKEYKMHEEAQLLRQAFDSYSGKIELDSKYNWSPKSKKLLNDIVNFQVATKIGLGFATIPNLTQVFISSVLKAGYAPFFRGTFKMLTDKKYRKNIKKNTGAGSLELHQILVGFDPNNVSLSSRVADRITRISQFQGINRINMLVSSYTGYEAALKWQKIAKKAKSPARKKWALRNLKSLGVLDANKKLNPRNMSRGMYEFSRDTQLQKNVFLEPAFANDPKFRPFFLFKRFGYRQFEWMNRQLREEVKAGNLMFPLRLAAGGMAGGMFVSAAKRLASDLIAGEDVYDENYKFGKDQIGLNDILDNFASVGAFGLVTDIVASESKWRALEFAAKPAMVQDAMKSYDALQKLVSDMGDFGLGFHVAQRTLKNIAPIFGTIPRRAAQRLETKGQRDSYVKYRYSKIHPRILDYMSEGNNRMAQRLIREWNNSFPERPIMYDDIGPKAINRRLMNKYEKRMNP